MGLDTNGIRLMLYAKRLGVNFQNVVTIGRQGLHLSSNQLRRQFSQFGIECTAHVAVGESRYCEPLFRLLGASSTESIDYSDYENATIVHDMNLPLPDHLRGRFSVVVDAGGLEHIFNYPVAIKNCMELMRAGGFFVGISPANNFMGHGFYQFSPELFFAVFAPQNGFELLKVILCEDYEDAQWYDVSNPKGGIQGRVTLVNHQPTYLMCIARRLGGQMEPLTAMPQQSDFIEAWNQPSVVDQGVKPTNLRQLRQFDPIKRLIKSIPGVTALARNIRYLCKPRFHRRDYTPIDPLL